MRPNDDNPDENYTTELNERTKNGGGCVELWEATSRYRNNSDDSFEPGNEGERRGFLKRLAGSLAIALAPLGLSGVASASHDLKPGDKIEVNAPPGGVPTRLECCVIRDDYSPCWDGTRFDGEEGVVVGECSIGWHDRGLLVAWDDVCTSCTYIDQHESSIILADQATRASGP